MAGTRTLSSEPPRSTAYYYADLERFKRTQNGDQYGGKIGGKQPIQDEIQNPDELSEYVESNEVINDGAIREVPPLRDRQWSLPEYSTPENIRKIEETYSTAGTFPMPEPKEKEPLLAELEIVGRLPLTQLDSSSGVRRSRSWYLCCPNVPDEDISRESSWRYSSLRPVTAPPLPRHRPPLLLATQSSTQEDLATVKAERDALARDLAATRQRAAAIAAAHDARLAELHGVIAELVRRRAAQDKQAIPEELGSDECESTTQPAGELDNDADRSKTDQNDTSSLLSPAELPTPRGEVEATPEDTTDTSNEQIRNCSPRVELRLPDCDINISEKDSELCLSAARCCVNSRACVSCDRECGSETVKLTLSPGGGESRRAKLASRVKLRRTQDLEHDEDNIARDVSLQLCAHADFREAIAQANHDGVVLSAWRARCARLEADCRVLQCALQAATDTAHRLSCACAVRESVVVCVCAALRHADQALETYDVLLALAETKGMTDSRVTSERVASQLLSRLESSARAGAPLLPRGPWAEHDNTSPVSPAWDSESEARLRDHAARLKAACVSARPELSPQMYSIHNIEDESCKDSVSMAEMEDAVAMQELLVAREARALAQLRLACGDTSLNLTHDTSSRPRKDRHWLDTRPSQTDL